MPRKVSLGSRRCIVLTGALLDPAVATQVVHDAVVSLRVRAHGRGHHVLKRQADTQ